MVAVLATVFFAAVYAPVLPYARQHDFLSFYTGASLVQEGRGAQLYDLAAQSTRERALVPGLVYIAPYIRPPFYAALLSPMALLPLTSAFVVWVSAQILVWLGVWRWAYRRFGPDSIVFCSLCLPAAAGIAHGQDCVFLLGIVLCAWLALERRREGLCGAMAGVLLIKFHLILLLPVAMVTARRWRALAGFLAVAAVEIGVSVAMIGEAGVRQYAALLTRKDLETLSPSSERMINAQALLANSGVDTWWVRVVAVAAVVMFMGVVVWRSRDGFGWFWMGILGSVLIAPHAYQYDAVLLMPLILACVCGTEVARRLKSAPQELKALRITAATAAFPVVYFATLLGPPWAGAASLVLVVWFVLLGRSGMMAFQT